MELVKDGPATEVKSEQDLHPGCVKRVLTVRDRLLIFHAVNSALAQGADAKSLARLVSLRELLDQDGVDDYFSAIDKTHAVKLQEWADKFRAFVGDRKLDDPGQKPKLTEEELLGHEATYWVKAKLDTYVSETIKGAKFDTSNAKYVVALFEKYGIKIDE